MVQIKLTLVAALAAMTVSAAPVSTRDEATDVACGAILSPLNTFLNYQAGNVATSTAGIVKGLDGLLSEIPDKNVNQIVTSATEGLANGVVNGVSTVLYGISTAVINADPACKSNMVFCKNELNAAKSGVAAGQGEAKDACLQAKYGCAAFFT